MNVAERNTDPHSVKSRDRAISGPEQKVYTSAIVIQIYSKHYVCEQGPRTLQSVGGKSFPQPQ